MGKTLIIGSCEPFSGKSALVLGMSRHLRSLDIPVRFGKPLATSLELEDKKIYGPSLLSSLIKSKPIGVKIKLIKATTR